MRTHTFIALAIPTLIVAIGVMSSAQAQSNNTVGPSVLFNGGNTFFGVDSKFGITDNFSLRPVVYFGNGATLLGADLTYDFTLPKYSKLTPFIGVGGAIAFASGSNSTVAAVVGGADFDISDTIQLKAALSFPVVSSNASNSTFLQLGAGLKF